MKKLFGLALVGLMALPAATATGQTAPAPAYDKAPWWMKESVVTQSGYVFTEIQANRARFDATFLTVDDSITKAQSMAIDKTRGLQQALAKLGKDKVRVTTNFTMRTLYEQYRDKDGNKVEDRRGDKVNGYEVSLDIGIEVRDMNLLEKAYALVLAASPSSASNISFSLQPSNEDNTWLYNEAVKDARKRAGESAAAAGGNLGKIKVIDPTGRACETDILARGGQGGDNTRAQEVTYANATPYAPVAMPVTMNVTPSATPPVTGSADYIEAQAAKNPFIQTPPLRRLEAKACVVYGVN